MATLLPLDAQPARAVPRDPRDVARPSRADSLLARGRLRAAEDALYAAVAARPRSPAARGALGRYLASRGRFVVADVLYDEALRFGADPGIVARAKAAMTPYRPPADAGPTALPVRFTFADDRRFVGRFAIEGRAGRVATAVLDPFITGVAVRSAEDAPREMRIGGLRLAAVDVTLDPAIPAGEVRVGLDLLWRLGFVFDERAQTLTLGVRSVPAMERMTHIPVVLTFPGISLVPRPGIAPIPLQDGRARALLRGSRWWLDADQGTIVVDR